VELSGGNKRKLCALLAMIGDPKVVFLDEPTSGMDGWMCGWMVGWIVFSAFSFRKCMLFFLYSASNFSFFSSLLLTGQAWTL
jgi:ABC-type nitrate/sulfonate/bicarbonate transport system ATPase subunit